MYEGTGAPHSPDISVVVIFYNMAREAPRTLYSLSAAYQRDIDPDDFEIIVVDNGSCPPLDPAILDELPGHFRLIRVNPAPSSPAYAINIGLAAARGRVIGLMIDGARIVTPGLLHFARAGVNLYPRAVVATMGWYLGYDQQRWAIECGYNKEREDKMLSEIGWQEDGYRLFDISAADETTTNAWFSSFCESNALFLNRESWNMLGGASERFDHPGGGFLNLDLMIEALELPDSKLVVLLGEGTFHQLHGGIATNASPRAISAAVAQWRAQYEAIRGRTWGPPYKPDRTYIGVLPRTPLARFARAVIEPIGSVPLGPDFDRAQWLVSTPPEPCDPTAAALLALAKAEVADRRFEAAAAVARIARSYAPDDVAIQQTISVACGWLRGPGAVEDLGELKRARFFLAQARAYAILGRSDDAEAAFTAALGFEPDLVDAHLGLAALRLPGPDHHQWLETIHSILQPATYLELGVDGGRTLSAARPGTKVVAVDPTAHVQFTMKTDVRLIRESISNFLDRDDLGRILENKPADLVFIAAAHGFETALEIFARAERLCGPQSVILLHNTIPLDERTQAPERDSKFYTGDTWKVVLCLKAARPDLTIRTVRTAPAGLTVITGLDPTSTLLDVDRDELVARFGALAYRDVVGAFDQALNTVDNDIGRSRDLLVDVAG